MGIKPVTMRLKDQCLASTTVEPLIRTPILIIEFFTKSHNSNTETGLRLYGFSCTGGLKVFGIIQHLSLAPYSCVVLLISKGMKPRYQKRIRCKA